MVGLIPPLQLIELVTRACADWPGSIVAGVPKVALGSNGLPWSAGTVLTLPEASMVSRPG